MENCEHGKPRNRYCGQCMATDYGNKSASALGSISRREKGEKAWESVALWPDEVSTGNDPNISTDKHDTGEMALSVCRALEREGLGGEGKIFPIETYVRPVENKQKK